MWHSFDTSSANECFLRWFVHATQHTTCDFGCTLFSALLIAIATACNFSLFLNYKRILFRLCFFLAHHRNSRWKCFRFIESVMENLAIIIFENICFFNSIEFQSFKWRRNSRWMPHLFPIRVDDKAFEKIFFKSQVQIPSHRKESDISYWIVSNGNSGKCHCLYWLISVIFDGIFEKCVDIHADWLDDSSWLNYCKMNLSSSPTP